MADFVGIEPGLARILASEHQTQSSALYLGRGHEVDRQSRKFGERRSWRQEVVMGGEFASLSEALFL